MTDTPLKAYWYGYMQYSSCTTDDEVTVLSKEQGHLDSLQGLFPDGQLDYFEVETGKHQNKAYYTFSMDVVDWPKPVRKLGRFAVCGMLDARPVARWCEQSIDVDVHPEQAEYIIGYLPQLRLEHLNNGKVRLYTCTTFETKQVLEYLYKDAPEARPSRKRLYDA